MRVETKGAFRQMVAKKVFIVTEQHPRIICEDKQSVLKKIDHVEDLNRETRRSSSEVEGNNSGQGQPPPAKRGRWAATMNM